MVVTSIRCSAAEALEKVKNVLVGSLSLCMHFIKRNSIAPNPAAAAAGSSSRLG